MAIVSNYTPVISDGPWCKKLSVRFWVQKRQVDWRAKIVNMRSSLAICMSILVLAGFTGHLSKAESKPIQDITRSGLAKLPLDTRKAISDLPRYLCRLVLKITTGPNSKAEALEFLATVFEEFNKCDAQGDTVLESLKYTLESDPIVLTERAKLKPRPKSRGLFFGRQIR